MIIGHVPGPWWINDCGGKLWIYANTGVPPEPEPIAQVDRSANARLIAAAPVLLEALQPFAYLARVMEEGQMLNFRGVYVSAEDARAAAAAIAKAKGES